MKIENALKWSRLWWLLSLDLAANFKDELWLADIAENSFNYIRSSLDMYSDFPTYGSDPRPKVYDRLQGFEHLLGRAALQHIFVVAKVHFYI